MRTVFITLTIVHIFIKSTDALECYSCLSVSDVNTCNSIHVCMDGQQCSAHGNIPSTIVGRDLNSTDCLECCSSDHCNKNLCQHLNTQFCIDHKGANCALLNKNFDICNDKIAASSYCSKFCGLCNIVDGNWTPWSDWSSCDVTCEKGSQSRTRSCTNPAPQHGGSLCLGKSTDIKACALDLCPVRLCIDKNGVDCAVLNSYLGICKNINSSKLYCPKFCGLCNVVDGNWTPWSGWSSCDVTCEKGSQSRSRSCTNPAPNHGGSFCLGKSTDTKVCALDLCPVDGNWTPWSDWSSCDVTCEKGSQSRTRYCTNPAPQHGGSLCVGKHTDTKACALNLCPVDGNWSPWFDWSACDVTCGKGYQSRSKFCTDPVPQHAGSLCLGKSTDTKVCVLDLCPVDGNWTPWSNWSACDVTCEKGSQTRTRSCTNPAPQHGGSLCVGRSTDTNACSLNLCPVDGNWTPWSDWSACDVTCEKGSQSRSKSCTNPAPQHGGSFCLGISAETKVCILDFCPAKSCIDGNGIDCALLNNSLYVCNDNYSAKKYCPKFCGLCSAEKLTTKLSTTTIVKPTTIKATTKSPTGDVCLFCRDVVSPHTCEFIKYCGIHEKCFIDQYVNSIGRFRYNLGCRDSQQCGSARSSRSRGTRDIGIYSAPEDSTLYTCTECCNSNLCYSGGCGEKEFSPITSGRRGPLCFKCDQQTSQNDCNRIRIFGRDEVCSLNITTVGTSNQMLLRTGCTHDPTCSHSGIGPVTFFTKQEEVVRTVVAKMTYVTMFAELHTKGSTGR